MGNLLSQVEQTLPPKFTPSPYQLFLKILVDTFDALMKGQLHEDQRKAHSALHVIALILTDGKEATSWFNFHNCKSEGVAHLIMAYCVCTLTRGDVNMGHNLTLFILAIKGVICAMKTLPDCTGESFTMDTFTRPRVSYTDIIKRAEDHATKKRSDPEGMRLMEFRIQIIISTLSLLGEDSQRMLTPEWWLLDREHLIAQPKEMMMEVYFGKEREDLLRDKHALEDREVAFQQKQDDSAVNSANYSRRDDSIVTSPHMPGNKDSRTALDPAMTIPPAGSISTPIPNDKTGQRKTPDQDNPELESYEGDPFALPDEQQLLNLEETEAKNFKHIGCFCRGDPMVDLDYPEIPPPKECSHFTGHYVDMLSRNGVALGPTWVSCRRMLMWELPDNCVRRSSHCFARATQMTISSGNFRPRDWHASQS